MFVFFNCFLGQTRNCSRYHPPSLLWTTPGRPKKTTYFRPGGRLGMSVSPHENLWKDSRHTCRQGKQTADKKNSPVFSPGFALNVGIIQFHGFFFYQIKLYIFFLWMNSILWFCSSLWIFMHTDFFFWKKIGFWGKALRKSRCTSLG